MLNRIAVIGGDGIGPEVVAEALKVVRAAGVELDTTDFELGGARYLRDGTVLPDDWMDQFQKATGVAPGNMASSWGMSEITGGVPRCAHGQYHFPPTIIPFLLEPHTRNALPRQGVGSGQIALLELNSNDCWGGLITGDRGTINWDGECACGREGPFLDAASIARL